MKKLFLTCVLVATAFAATAGEEPKHPSWSGFVTNGFWDNWEVSVGLGAGTAFTSGTNAGSFCERLGFEGNVSLLKWLNLCLRAWPFRKEWWLMSALFQASR